VTESTSRVLMEVVRRRSSRATSTRSMGHRET
jgi:hypothetical protein